MTTPMLSAKAWFADKAFVRSVNRLLPTIARVKVLQHDDYMEMAEDYADYVCRYEKQEDRRN